MQKYSLGKDYREMLFFFIYMSPMVPTELEEQAIPGAADSSFSWHRSVKKQRTVCAWPTS